AVATRLVLSLRDALPIWRAVERDDLRSGPEDRQAAAALHRPDAARLRAARPTLNGPKLSSLPAGTQRGSERRSSNDGSSRMNRADRKSTRLNSSHVKIS